MIKTADATNLIKYTKTNFQCQTSYRRGCITACPVWRQRASHLSQTSSWHKQMKGRLIYCSEAGVDHFPTMTVTLCVSNVSKQITKKTIMRQECLNFVRTALWLHDTQQWFQNKSFFVFFSEINGTPVISQIQIVSFRCVGLCWWGFCTHEVKEFLLLPSKIGIKTTTSKGVLCSFAEH